MDMTVTQFITLGIALVGAILGIVNTWHNLRQSRVRLKVTPQTAQFIGPNEGVWTSSRELLPGAVPCIEVVNLSSFPVTIDEVGYSKRSITGRFAVPVPLVYDNKPWPRRLEPRESVTAYLKIEREHCPMLRGLHKAYAKTTCDTIVYGNSRALQQLIEFVKATADKLEVQSQHR